VGSDPDFVRTLKKAAAALRDAEVPYLLGGGFAIWAHGGSESDHDIDFVVKPQDADRGLEALAEVGLRPERPPEEWLYKAYDGDILVDLIFAPAGLAVDDELISRGNELEVQAQLMPVMRPDDVLVTKLMAMTEHALSYESCLEIARSLREQIDWDYVRVRTAGSPFARAFFELVDGLEIATA
jgi:putative nucleotidyltransferase-like protein